jgi:hypothetical protein
MLTANKRSRDEESTPELDATQQLRVRKRFRFPGMESLAVDVGFLPSIYDPEHNLARRWGATTIRHIPGTYHITHSILPCFGLPINATSFFSLLSHIFLSGLGALHVELGALILH